MRHYFAELFAAFPVLIRSDEDIVADHEWHTGCGGLAFGLRKSTGGRTEDEE